MTIEVIISLASALQAAPLFTPTPKAAGRAIEFLPGEGNNDDTRKSYLKSTCRFKSCDACGLGPPANVGAVHVGALLMLFDWLLTRRVLDANTAHAAREPEYVVKKGKTLVMTADEARELHYCAS
jgi:hypothetical protein